VFRPLGHWFLVVAMTLAAAMASCERTKPQQQATSAAAPQPSLAPSVGEPPRGPVVLTLEDVTAIQKSLYAYLLATDGPKSGWFEDRELLLLHARSAGWIDEDGAIRIAAWVLNPTSHPLKLWLRVPGLETAPAIRAYVAELAPDPPWRVVSVHHAHIRRR
jgi:hypothetical protein